MILRMTVALATAVSLMSAFFLASTADSLYPPGSRTIVTVWDRGDRVGAERAKTIIRNTAATHDIDLVKSWDTVSSDGTHRVFAVVHGDDTSFLRYRDFDPQYRSTTVSWRAVPDAEVLGMYLTPVSGAHAETFAADLTRQGVDSGTTAITPFSAALWLTEETPFPALIISGWLGSMIGCMAWSVGRRRSDAILRSFGAHHGAIVTEQLLRLGRSMALAFAGGTCIALPALAVYNGLAQFGRFLAMYSATSVCLLVGLACAVAITSSVLARSDPRTFILGRGAARGFGLLSSAAHATVCILVAGTIAGTALIGAAAHRLVGEETAWARTGNLSALSFRISEAQFIDSRDRCAAIANREDARGSLVVAAHPRPPFVGHDPNSGNSLIVNSHFVDTQRIQDERGNQIGGDQLDPDALTLLVPKRLDGQRDELVRTFGEWSAFDDQPGDGPAREVEIRVLSTRDDQAVFNFGAGIGEDRSFQVDPVIAVLPQSQVLPSADWIASTMTSGGVLFERPDRVVGDLRRADLTQFIGSVERVRDHASAMIASDLRRFRTSLLMGCAVLVALGLSAAVLASTLSAKSRRRDFIRFAHGATPFTMFRPLGSVIAGVSLPLFALLGAGLLHGPFVAIASLVAVTIDATVVLGFLAVATHRRRRAMISNR